MWRNFLYFFHIAAYSAERKGLAISFFSNIVNVSSLCVLMLGKKSKFYFKRISVKCVPYLDCIEYN